MSSSKTVVKSVVGSSGPVGPNATATVEKLLKQQAESVTTTFQVLEVATVPKFDEKDAVSLKSFKVKKLIHRCLFDAIYSGNDRNLGDDPGYFAYICSFCSHGGVIRPSN